VQGRHARVGVRSSPSAHNRGLLEPPSLGDSSQALRLRQQSAIANTSMAESWERCPRGSREAGTRV